MTPTRHLPRGRTALAVLAAAVLLLTGTTAAVLATRGQAGVAGSIDGREVSDDELAFYVRLTPEYAQVAARADRDDAAADPAAREAAWDLLAQDQALLDLAHEAGLTDVTSVPDLLAGLDSSNADRADAVERGEIVYGAVRHDEAAFRGKALADLRAALRRALSEGPGAPLAVPDAEVAAHLDAHPQDWSAGVATYETTRLTVPAAPGTAPGAEPSPDLSGSAPGATGALDLDRVAAGTAGATLTPVTVTQQDLRSSTLNPRTAEQLATLEPGQTTDPERVGDTWTVLRLDAVDVDRAAALELYAPRIRTVLQDTELDALLAERVAGQRRDPAVATSTTQHSTTQHSTTQHSTTQHSSTHRQDRSEEAATA